MLRYFLHLATASCLLAYTAFHREPLVHRLEPLFPFSMVVAGVLLAFALKKEGRRRMVLSTLCAGAIAAGLGVELRFDAVRRSVLEADPQALERLGRHVVVGIEDWNVAEDLVRRGAVAGVFLTIRNVRGLDVEQVRARVERLRELHSAPGRPEFLVMADQEGGPVSRMSPPLPYQAALGAVLSSAQSVDEQRQLARLYGETQAEGLAAIGVNVNLGPVVDVAEPDVRGLLDPFGQISTRAIGADPEQVSRAAAAYAEGLERHGVRATFKHFPGLGRARADTHLFETAIETPAEELRRHDWLPYAKALPGSHSLVMVGHVLVPAVDPDTVSSLSAKLVTGVLREQLGHQGLVITDDLCMRPVTTSPGGLQAAGVRALNAGVDLLLVSYDSAQYFEVMAGLLEAEREGRLDRALQEASLARLGRPALVGALAAR